MKAALLTTAAILALLPSASAQEPQPIRVNYVYEWIHVKPELSPPGISDFVGGLWMSDITSTTPGIGQFSQIEGYIRQGNDIILDCDLGIGRSPVPVTISCRSDHSPNKRPAI